jgi:hypothetical protein
MFEDFEVVSCYTRANAIADGVLIDVTERACQVGFKLPTVVTATVWSSIIEMGNAEIESLRLTAFLARCCSEAIYSSKQRPNARRVNFSYGDENLPVSSMHNVIIDIGPGDNAEPVLTIMFPCDD